MGTPTPPNPPPTPNPTPGTWGDSFARWFSNNFFKHILLTLGLILMIIVIDIISVNFAEGKAVEWLNMYNGKMSSSGGAVTPTGGNANTATTQSAANANSANTQTQAAANLNANNGNANVDQRQGSATGNTTATPPGNQNQSVPGTEADKPATPNPEQKQRLDEQLMNIRARISHHGTVMAFFFKAYYMAISVIMFAGLIAAVALFFIAQIGWGPTNPFVKNVFLVMTAATLYYGLFPSVFQQQQNISDNKDLFLAYKALENEVISYPVTITKDSKKPEEFIGYVDSELKRLGNIAIGFDYTKVNYKNGFDISERSNDSENNNVNNGNKNLATPGRRNQ